MVIILWFEFRVERVLPSFPEQYGLCFFHKHEHLSCSLHLQRRNDLWSHSARASYRATPGALCRAIEKVKRLKL